MAIKYQIEQKFSKPGKCLTAKRAAGRPATIPTVPYTLWYAVVYPCRNYFAAGKPIRGENKLTGIFSLALHP
jgi:hypothetical protein